MTLSPYLDSADTGDIYPVLTEIILLPLALNSILVKLQFSLFTALAYSATYQIAVVDFNQPLDRVPPLNILLPKSEFKRVSPEDGFIQIFAVFFRRKRIHVSNLCPPAITVRIQFPKKVREEDDP